MYPPFTRTYNAQATSHFMKYKGVQTVCTPLYLHVAYVASLYLLLIRIKYSLPCWNGCKIRQITMHRSDRNIVLLYCS